MEVFPTMLIEETILKSFLKFMLSLFCIINSQNILSNVAVGQAPRAKFEHILILMCQYVELLEYIVYCDL